MVLTWVLCTATILAAWHGVDNGVTSSMADYRSIESADITSGFNRDLGISYTEEKTALSFGDGENTFDTPFDIDNETLAAKINWPLESIRAFPYTRENNNGQPVLVAVLDTGIDVTHEDLVGKVVDQVSMVEGTDPDDHHGHGTFIAGIVAADVENDIGINGVAPECRLLNVKVADDRGRCRHDDLAEGIVWAVDHGANIINISIVMQSSTSVLETAIDYAWEHGVIVVAAAGNDGSDVPVYPAAYSSCISSTAIRSDLTLAPLANYGDWVDVAAPGYDIYATLPGDEYGYEYGTSFAAAYVTGLAARLLSLANDENQDGNLRDAIILSILYGCRDIGIDGTGRGFIDVQRSADVLISSQS